MHIETRPSKKHSVRKANAEKLLFNCFKTRNNSYGEITTNDWEYQLGLNEQICKDMRKALTFPKKSIIGVKDLHILMDILRKINSGQPIPIDTAMPKKDLSGYTLKERIQILTRLKMLGEIYDPYQGVNKKKEGKYIQLI